MFFIRESSTEISYCKYPSFWKLLFPTFFRQIYLRIIFINFSKGIFLRIMLGVPVPLIKLHSSTELFIWFATQFAHIHDSWIMHTLWYTIESIVDIDMYYPSFGSKSIHFTFLDNQNLTRQLVHWISRYGTKFNGHNARHTERVRNCHEYMWRYFLFVSRVRQLQSKIYFIPFIQSLQKQPNEREKISRKNRQWEISSVRDQRFHLV